MKKWSKIPAALKGVGGAAKEKAIIKMGKGFYKGLRKRYRRDPVACDYLDKILKAIDEKDEQTLEKYQAILGGYLAADPKMKKQMKRMYG